MKFFQLLSTRCALACCALFGLAASALAAESFDVHCANIQYLTDKKIQADVGISEAQRTRMNKHADAYRARMAAYQKELEQTKKQPDEARLQRMILDMKAQVIAELSASQVKRLRELTLQFTGLAGVLDEVVATKIGITSANLTKLRKIFADGHDKVEKIKAMVQEEAFKPYAGKKPKDQAEEDKWKKDVQARGTAAAKRYAPRVKQIEQDTQAAMLKIVTVQQQNAYKALQGVAYKPK